MQSFDDKGSSEVETYTVGFAKRLASGDTLLAYGAGGSNTNVSIAVLETSPIPDANPSAMLSGSPALNAAQVTIKGVANAALQALQQTLIGGVIGCVYVLKYTATTSLGRNLVEPVVITVVE